MFSKRLQTRCAPEPTPKSADATAAVAVPVSITSPSLRSPVSSPPSQTAALGGGARPDDMEDLMTAEAARHKEQMSAMARIAPSPCPGDSSLSDLAAAEASRAQAMLAMFRPAAPPLPTPPLPESSAEATQRTTLPALISQDVRTSSVGDAPNGAGAPRSQRFQVMHNQCVVRSEPTLTSRTLDVRQRGDFVIGVEETFDGWVRLAGQLGWMLRDMQGKGGLGVLLEPVGRPQKLAVPRLTTDTGNQMFRVVCRDGAQIRSEPSEQASVVGARAYGEFVFAETQNYHGWVRLAEHVGWMTCFSAEKGELLQHFNVDGSEDYEKDTQPCDTDDGPPTVFDEVLRRESPVDIVHEDELCLAFYEIDPQAPVHVLVIPKVRDGLTQLSKARDDQKVLLGHLFLVAGRLGSRLCAEGFRVVVNDGENGAQSIYHLHVHVLGGRPLAWPPG